MRARREQRDHQTISDYRLQVERLRGRINVMADHRDSTAVIKFDGWPEVNQKKKKMMIKKEWTSISFFATESIQLVSVRLKFNSQIN